MNTEDYFANTEDDGDQGSPYQNESGNGRGEPLSLHLGCGEYGNIYGDGYFFVINGNGRGNGSRF
jgi:hypothetical protein